MDGEERTKTKVVDAYIIELISEQGLEKSGLAFRPRLTKFIVEFASLHKW